MTGTPPAAERARAARPARRPRSRDATARSSGDDPASSTFFRAFTPVDELALLEIGSRPRAPARTATDYLGSLRAIPWVFAWTQNRMLLPAWYGCGTAFAALDAGELRAPLPRAAVLPRRSSTTSR